MAEREPSILLVDDDKDICENMADIFTELGYHVDVAHQGRAALELVRGRWYDVALLDLKMPGMDGVALYREIRKIRAGMVAMLVTAYASGSAADEAISAGASYVIPKPVDMPRLVELIDQALGRPLVLIVDDDNGLCANLWDLLHEQGYRTCVAHNAEQALEQVRSSTQIVLIDLMLPGRHGGEVFRRIRATHPRARTILITGERVETQPLIAQLQVEGVDAVCYKPFDVPGLLQTLAQFANTRDDQSPGPPLAE
jgi:CheY-like chemotaxis protein